MFCLVLRQIKDVAEVSRAPSTTKGVRSYFLAAIEHQPSKSIFSRGSFQTFRFGDERIMTSLLSCCPLFLVGHANKAFVQRSAHLCVKNGHLLQIWNRLQVQHPLVSDPCPAYP